MKYITILAICLQVVASVIVRPYNEVNYEDFSSFQEFALKYLTLNHGMNTNTNLIIGVAEPHCKERLTSPAFRGAQRHAGGDVLSIVSVPAKGFPKKLSHRSCIEAFFYRYNTSITNPTSQTTNFNHQELTSWSSQQMRTDFRFKNGFDFDIVYYWHEESHEPVRQGILHPGESTQIGSFLGHIFAAYRHDPDKEEFVARELVEGGGIGLELLDFMVVSAEDYTFSPVNRLETCEVMPGASNQFVEGELNCEDMDMRLVEFSHNVWYQKRKGLNYVQPQMVRAVTPEGFKHRKLPVGTHDWLKAWYDAEKIKVTNSEGGVGPCMNQHVAPSRVTHITPELKERLARELKPILEDWYGGDLHMTSIYGIREYNNGSVLRMHVDTVATHVVSAIVNVDQAVDKDWPLIILDHDDNEHSVIMKPGDMVLYESAKLLHGRPDAFVGGHYDNIFVHFQPISGWDYSWV